MQQRLAILAVPFLSVIAALVAPRPVWAVINSAASQCPAGTTENATNIAANGDFSSLSVATVPQGFTSGFTYVSEATDVLDNEVSIRVGDHTQAFVDQTAFPGDPVRSVPAAANWLYANGNSNATATAIWEQDVAVTAGQSYTVYIYASNTIDPALAAGTTASWAIPRVSIEVEGAAGTEVTLPYETGSDDWTIVQGVFNSGAATNVTIRILDNIVSNTTGDDVGLAAINIRACDLSGDPDIDGDSIPNSLDEDDDNDGIPDVIEGSGDPDGDLVINSSDRDSDNDGIYDAHEAWPGNRALDVNNDGALDAAIANSGANGLLDSIETVAESGLVDYDGDNAQDAPANTDNDADPDYLDIDSDGDTLSDATENFYRNNTGFDGDDDGRAGTGAVTVDAFGVVTSSTAGAVSYPVAAINSDTDNLPDRLDLDSDGDGVGDQIEGADDSDNDGRADFRDADDFDQDGVPDDTDIDDDNDGIPDTAEQSAGGADVDTDSDGVFDRLDPDSDNDGIYDLREADPAMSSYDADNDGKVDGTAVGTNGLLDAIETAADTGVADYDNDGSADDPANSDSDAVADFRDLDADNDGVPDALESGDSAAVIDGRVSGTINPDGVALSAAYTVPVDSDGDGIADFRDLDSDADGLTDAVEAGLADQDEDGRVDGLADGNGDGMHDGAVVALPDSDGDGAPDLREPGDTANDPSIVGGLAGQALQTGLDGFPGGGSLGPVSLLLLWGVFGAFRRRVAYRSITL